MKEIANAWLLFSWNSQQVGGNPHAHPDLLKQLENHQAQLHRLMKKCIALLEGNSIDSSGELQRLSSDIANIAASVNVGEDLNVEGLSYSICADRVKTCTKEIADTMGSIVSKVKITFDDVLDVANILSEKYSTLTSNGKLVLSSVNKSDSKEVAQEISNNLKEIGTCSLKLVESLKAISLKNDFTNKQKHSSNQDTLAIKSWLFAQFLQIVS
jgi:hypothetical protein